MVMVVLCQRLHDFVSVNGNGFLDRYNVGEGHNCKYECTECTELVWTFLI